MKYLIYTWAALALLAAVSGRAKADFTNGDFQAGLTGWTAFTTPNGTNGTSLPDVVSFNTTGNGPSLSAHFNVGEVTFTTLPEGGGIRQDLTLTAGTYSITGNFASFNSGVNANEDAGTFSVLVDNVPVETVSLGLINSDQTLLGQFDATFTLGAGTHDFAFEITRIFTSVEGLSPDEYLTNLHITPEVAAVPEPSTLALLGIGALGLAGRGWLRRKRAAA